MQRRVAVRSLALVAGTFGLLFTAYWRLSVSEIIYDEPTYAAAGWAYVHGSFAENREHPPLAKYVFGVGQLVFGRGVVGSRTAAATCGVAIGILLFVFGKRLAGFWTGVAAAGLWVMLPRPIGSTVGLMHQHLDRFAMLDVVMAAFAIAGIYIGWLWIDTGSWRWALGAGILLGLAIASKMSVISLPIVVGGMGIARCRTSRAVNQGLALCGASVVAFVLTYVPFRGSTISAWQGMLSFQSKQYAAGHPIYAAGRVYGSAPWWAALWFQWVDHGPWVMTALIVSCVAALTLVRGWAPWYLLATTLAPMLMIMTSSIVLPHYVFAWFPQMLMLAGLGLAALFGRSRASTAVGAAILVVVVIAGTGWLAHLATLRPDGYARLPQLVSSDSRSTSVVVDAPQYIVGFYLPHARILSSFPATRAHVSALILAHDPRFPASTEADLIKEARARGMHEVRLSDIDVWVASRRD